MVNGKTDARRTPVAEARLRKCDLCGRPTVYDKRTIRVVEYGEFMYNPPRFIQQLCGDCWGGVAQVLRLKRAEQLERDAREMREGKNDA